MLEKDNKLRLAVIANWAQGNAISGGDRIFIELVKRWANKPSAKVHLLISQEGLRMCERSGMTDCEHSIWSFSQADTHSMPLNFLDRTIKSIAGALRYHPDENTIIYSSSDFWPDSIPALVIKLKNRNLKGLKWIAGFYLFASPPWRKESPYKGKKMFIGLFYWLTQLPIYWLTNKFADTVFVTSEPDVEKFITNKRDASRVAVIRGGVDTIPSEAYLETGNILQTDMRKYDACFVGRLHYQKGVIELIKIWEFVCSKKNDAKLAIIGVGPLENELKDNVKEMGLQNNIELLGFKDGKEKYEIFKQSKIFVHPATYDSGGMAACEAMAWGLPGVSFDLEALKTYYPKGMLKTPHIDFNKFAENIMALLDDEDLYIKTRDDAISWAREWDWDKRAEEIFNYIQKG